MLISTAIADAGGVRVAVSDSGPGLASGTLDRLFEAFYTTKASGLGLGLSICRSIIEAHGGQLWASANVPRGATFQFTVPPHPDAASWVPMHPCVPLLLLAAAHLEQLHRLGEVGKRAGEAVGP